MKIGKIISVEYDKFRVKLFHNTKLSTLIIEGKLYYFGNIGSYLKTKNAIGDTIVCEVIGIFDNIQEKSNFSDYNLDSSKELILKPIGTIDSKKRFAMGIGIYPAIYADVEILLDKDLDDILNPSDKGKKPTGEHSNNDTKNKEIIHKLIELGISKNMINYKIKVNIDKLFNIHTAVLGNSGSGKSNTIATILQTIYRKIDFQAIGSKIILFDVNGEYFNALKVLNNSGIKVTYYKPNTDNGSKFYLPYYLMNLDEWLAFLMASDKIQKPFWDKVLQESYYFYKLFMDNDEQYKYVEYIKYKIKIVLSNILSKVENDTVKITTSIGIITKIREIVLQISNNNELINIINDVLRKCSLYYGTNGNELHDYISSLEIDYLNEYINNSEKIKYGSYFDYKYLKIAIEFVLIDEESRGNIRIREFISTMLTRLDFFLDNPECNFIKDDTTIYNNSNEYIGDKFSISNDKIDDQLFIIDTSELGKDLLELLTGVLSRMIFEYRKSKDGDKRNKQPIHLILDEAHRYIKEDAQYILRENIFERIAREGRKYALYLIVSSQRPSELSSTVLSQCGNYIIHRIQNEVDIKYIYSVLPYYSPEYTNRIKQSIPGEALIFGNCVPMPLHIRITKASPEPNSSNCNISDEWFKEPK